MKYKYCRDCKYRCSCCSSYYGNYINCSGCGNYYDEFSPASWIIYCPKLGVPVTKLEDKELKSNGN